MKTLILPLVVALLGLAAGVGAGMMSNSSPEPQAAIGSCGETETRKASDPGAAHEQDAETADTAGAHGSEEESEYVKLNNQFVVPVVNGDLVDALVVLSLSLEVTPGQREAIYAREPKLRDSFLQVLFDHANMGGFQGNFTKGNNLELLRTSLTEAARDVLGPSVKSVLIFDIARQDV